LYTYKLSKTPALRVTFGASKDVWLCPASKDVTFGGLETPSQVKMILGVNNLTKFTD
jgi:hypothetical protein